MAITVTNLAALDPFRARLLNVAASHTMGATAPNADVLVLGDSMSSSIRNREFGTLSRRKAWVHQLLDALKGYAGDAGTVWPASHTDESYGGGRYIAGTGSAVDRVRRWGVSPWAARMAAIGGKRPYAASDVSNVGMGAYSVKPSTVPVKCHPLQDAFRYIDVIYSRAASGLGNLTVTVDGTATAITSTADPADYNNVLTIDAGFNGYHNVEFKAAANYCQIEAIRLRTGLPGVLDRSVAQSGQRLSVLKTNYGTGALKNLYAGVTALGSPDMAIFMLGYNDGAAASWNAASQTTIAEETTAWIDQLNVPTMWVIPPANDGGTTKRTEWNAIKVAVLAAVADASQVCVVDCHDGITGWATGTEAEASGYIGGSNIHRNWARGGWADLGDIVVPSAGPDGTNIYECTTAGACKTSAGDPTWDTTEGNTTADGDAVWTCRRAASVPVGQLVVDSTHPNEKGSRVMCDAILSGLGWDAMVAGWRGVGSGSTRMGIGL